MTTLWLKILVLCLICIEYIHSEITIVNPNGEQETTPEPKSKSKTTKSKQDSSTKSKVKASKKKAHSQYNLMWVTPFEIFNISTPNDNIVDPSINGIMSEYAQYLYNRFRNGLNDGSITLSGIDEKASLNDKFFALQQYLHETNNFHGSSAVPQKEFTILKLQIRNVVNVFLNRCGVDKEVIKSVLSTITVDGGPDENENNNINPSEKMFLWATMLSNGSYHAPHSHQDSIISGVYFAKIPTNPIGDNEDGVGGNLVFGDPRGNGIYPFGLKYIHQPIEGQIVLFPGYLTHWVEPVKSADMRISFSFNIPGSWEDLSDTSMFHKF